MPSPVSWPGPRTSPTSWTPTRSPAPPTTACPAAASGSTCSHREREGRDARTADRECPGNAAVPGARQGAVRRAPSLEERRRHPRRRARCVAGVGEPGRLLMACAAGVRASPPPKNSVASVTGIASTSLMSLPPNLYSSTSAWNRLPSHSSQMVATCARWPFRREPRLCEPHQCALASGHDDDSDRLGAELRLAPEVGPPPAWWLGGTVTRHIQA